MKTLWESVMGGTATAAPEVAPPEVEVSAGLELRDYQEAGVKAINESLANHGAPIWYGPTGCGKTVVGIGVIEARKAERTLFVTPRSSLMTQGVKRLEAEGYRAAYTGAEVPGSGARFLSRSEWPDAAWPHGIDVMFCTPTTAAKRDLLKQGIGLAIFDECHHSAMKDGWVKGNAYASTASLLMKGGVKCFGLTATPGRAEEDMGFRSVGYSELIAAPAYKVLADQGWLAHMRVMKGAREIKHGGVLKVTGDYDLRQIMESNDPESLVDAPCAHIAETPGRIIVFCVTQRHAVSVAACLAEKHRERVALTLSDKADVSGVHCDPFAIPAFLSGESRVLVSVGKVNEGFDCPSADRVVMLRPTKSVPLMLQCAGRASRPAPDKTEAVFEDWVGVTADLGSPTDGRSWSLYSRKELATLQVAYRRGAGGSRKPPTLEDKERNAAEAIREGASLENVNGNRNRNRAATIKGAHCRCWKQVDDGGTGCRNRCFPRYDKHLGDREFDCGCRCNVTDKKGNVKPCGCVKPRPDAKLTYSTRIDKYGKSFKVWVWEA